MISFMIEMVFYASTDITPFRFVEIKFIMLYDFDHINV